VSSNSQMGGRNCRIPLKMMIGEAQSAAQSSAAAFLLNKAAVIPTNARPEVMASLK
jgi:hypothetical protein